MDLIRTFKYQVINTTYLGFLVLALSHIAAQTARSDTLARDQARPQNKAIQYKLWLGAGLGLGYLQSLQPQVEQSKPGYGLLAHGYLSRHAANKTQFNLGLGWENSRFFLFEEEKLNDGKEKDIEVRTRYATLELSLLQQLTPSLALGPLLKTSFGTDTSFAPSKQISDKQPNLFVGLQSFLTISDQAANRRLNFQLLTDLSIPERQVYLFNLSIDLGFELFHTPAYLIKKVIVEKTIAQPSIRNIAVEKHHYRLLIDAGIINFATGQHEILNTYQAYLDELGQYLASHPQLWDQLIIASHTDARGGQGYNRALSFRRAYAVKGILGRYQLPHEKIKLSSFAARLPVDQDQDSVSLARNRRVEIILIGAQDALRLRSDILRMQQRHRLPQTCKGQLCQ